jgi:choline dehydrogenase
VEKRREERNVAVEALWRQVKPLGLSRRRFLVLLSSGGVAAVLSACGIVGGPPSKPGGEAAPSTAGTAGAGSPADGPREEFEYVVVGSGAGGGPLAANLARRGHTVLLLEAGGADAPINYSVPAFHGLATEDPALSWQYFVKHYADEQRQRLDLKRVVGEDGESRIFYPRAGTLGGCTAHYAMIIVYPHNSDWDYIADVTGDDSWQSGKMRQYFERIERYHYIDRAAYPTVDDPTADDDGFWREIVSGALDTLKARARARFRAIEARFQDLVAQSRHGYNGWLPVNRAPLTLALRDEQLLKTVKFACATAIDDGLLPISTLLDPNHWEVAQRRREGFLRVPTAMDGKNRRGTREYLLETAARYPDKLIIRTHALVTKVLWSEDGMNTVVGVEYLDGAHLYNADPLAGKEYTGTKREVRVTREVILAGGAFNTPQLLMLSGIGPQAELARRHIPVRVDLPGVGKNLQDRYEVGVICEMREHFPILAGTTFTDSAADPAFAEWKQGKGLYATNGAVLGLIKRSRKQRLDPDLFIFGVPGHFEGYKLGWAEEASKKYKNRFTWAILKGHTNNTAGTVTLRTNDPREVPEINFHYFDEGSDAGGEDLQAVVEGVKFARRMNRNMPGLIRREILPGPTVRTDEHIKQFIKNNAWGHHACGTCKMGLSSDPLAVVDSKFRVHGTKNLRVVDASIFPKIPGFFIVTPVYMISEKASDVIHEATL